MGRSLEYIEYPHPSERDAVVKAVPHPTGKVPKVTARRQNVGQRGNRRRAKWCLAIDRGFVVHVDGIVSILRLTFAGGRGKSSRMRDKGGLSGRNAMQGRNAPPQSGAQAWLTWESYLILSGYRGRGGGSTRARRTGRAHMGLPKIVILILCMACTLAVQGMLATFPCRCHPNYFVGHLSPKA